MEIQKEAFGGLIEYYKKLPLNEKRNEIIDELEDMISKYSDVCSKLGIMPNMALNKEILNVKGKDLKEEEFLHAIYAYINTLEDINAQFIEIISRIIIEEKGKVN